MRFVAVCFLLVQSVGNWAVVSEDALPNQAAWISVSNNVAPQQVVFLRRVFEVGPKLVKAVLLAAADQGATVYCNGTGAADISGFTRATSINVTGFIHVGTNVLACSVTNSSGAPAMRLMLELVYADGRQRWVVSDGAWLASNVETEKWTEPVFGTEGWTFAYTYERDGLQKWGDPFHVAKSPDAYNSWMLARNTDQAAPPETITAPAGFKVELLRSAAPNEDSWVALAFDPKGRLTIAREKVGLLRLTLAGNRVGQVEVIEDTLLECRGLLYAYDSLYVNANNSKGFYRLRDTDGDDQFDEKKLLLKTDGGVGHGRNQLTLGPDGFIYLAHGDDVVLPVNLATNSPVQQMMDDQLMPVRDPRHPRSLRRYTQVGHILQTDREGTFFRLVAGGLRNPLDVAFNETGEMFTYDADMERDLAAPWYHPTRVLHLVSGADFGWRRSMPNIAPYAPDVLPAAVDIGVGSPTGVGFGTASHFPEKYRRAFFIADWAYGRILAIHLNPKGSTYKGSAEEFLSGRPLNVTDFTFGPDGAMYFITGGRGTKSGLYRVGHRNHDRSTPENGLIVAEDRSTVEARGLRKKLEALSDRDDSPDVIEMIWWQLGSPDRWIRYTARNVLERQPLHLWLERAMREANQRISLTALLGVGRIAGKETQERLLLRIGELLDARLSESERVEMLRLIALTLARFGPPDEKIASTLSHQLEILYPSAGQAANHELCRILSFLRAPSVISKTTALIARTRSTEDLLHYTRFLASVQEGWTSEQRHTFFDALRRAEQEQGGSDYYSAISSVRKEAVAQLSSEESQKLAGCLLPAKALPVTIGAVSNALPLVREWRLEDFDFNAITSNIDLSAGQQAFNNVGCVLCHRFGDRGGVFGPDLTSVAARFGPRDVLDAILNPSKAIDEKYRTLNITLKDEEVVSGLFEREDDETLVLSGAASSESSVEIPKANIAFRRVSEVSPMPGGLLNVLTRKQIFDMLAFLQRGATNAIVGRVGQ